MWSILCYDSQDLTRGIEIDIVVGSRPIAPLFEDGLLQQLQRGQDQAISKNWGAADPNSHQQKVDGGQTTKERSGRVVKPIEG